MRNRFQVSGYRRQQLVRSLAAGLVTAVCGLALVSTPIGTKFERTIGLDWLFKVRGVTQPPPDVAVVAITNRTGAALGLPKEPHDWSRTVHARLIERLVEQDVPIIVFDFDFSNPKPGDEDAIFARAIAQADRVVLFEGMEQRSERVVKPAGGDGGSISIERLHRPAPVLAAAAKAIGPFPLPKLDQAAFDFWTFKASAGGMPTTAAVALQLKALPFYEEWLGVLKQAQAPAAEHLPTHVSDLKGPNDLEQLMLTFRRMFREHASLQQRVGEVLDQVYGEPRDAETRTLLAALAALYAGPDNYYINFYGPPGTIRTVPYEQVLSLSGSESAPQGVKLSHDTIFVGRADLNDSDHPDRFYTSFTGKDGVDLSGVEIMATAYANLLTQRTLLPSSPLSSSLVVIAFGLIVGMLVYLLPATIGVPAAIALTALYAAVLQWRFNQADLWLPLVTPALQLLFALLIGLMGQYLLERRKERQLTQAIRYYLPENVVRDLGERQVDPTTLNRVVFGTCLATDMSDFIALGESKSPQELATFMNTYFDALAQALTHHGVDVMEFRADMIMCAWVSPSHSPDLCRKGMYAAIEVTDIIERFAHQYGSRHFNPRVGLHDGDVYVGHTGGGGRFLYSIVGDAANTAARLESLNKHLGTQILAAESVVRDADGFLLRPLGLFQLKGKTDPTSVVEILGRHDTAKPEHHDLCARFAEALAAFQSKEWHRAMSLFEATAKKHGTDGPSYFYLSCSQKFALEPPVHHGPTIIRMGEK